VWDVEVLADPVSAHDEGWQPLDMVSLAEVLAHDNRHA